MAVVGVRMGSRGARRAGLALVSSQAERSSLLTFGSLAMARAWARAAARDDLFSDCGTGRKSLTASKEAARERTPRVSECCHVACVLKRLDTASGAGVDGDERAAGSVMLACSRRARSRSRSDCCSAARDASNADSHIRRAHTPPPTSREARAAVAARDVGVAVAGCIAFSFVGAWRALSTARRSAVAARSRLAGSIGPVILSAGDECGIRTAVEHALALDSAQMALSSRHSHPSGRPSTSLGRAIWLIVS